MFDNEEANAETAKKRLIEANLRSKLCEFAYDVLQLMEDTEEWDADMLQEIQDAADKQGLCGQKEDGYFCSHVHRNTHVDGTHTYTSSHPLRAS